jgi:hypothetical protein
MSHPARECAAVPFAAPEDDGRKMVENP